MNWTIRWATLAMAGVCSLLFPALARAQFDIQINYSGAPEYRYAFDWAETQLERRITGYQPGISLTGLTINASIIDIPDVQDGIGTKNLLGQANYSSTVLRGGYRLATAGFMEFDVDDLPFIENAEFPVDVTPYNVLPYIVVHEMMHVLGLGVLWEANGLVSGNQYTGEHALAAYQQEWLHPGGIIPASIPIETEGGAGTANFHWNEVLNGSAFTGILLKSDPTKDFAYEIATGWLNYRRYPPLISRTTVQQFADLGYTVVPEPASLWAAASALIPIIFGRRLAGRRRAA